MADVSRRRAPNKTVEQVYAEANDQIDFAARTDALSVRLGKGRRSFARLPSLRRLRHIHSLDLSGTNIQELAPVSELTSLQELKLAWTRVIDLGPLQKITNLRRLVLRRYRLLRRKASFMACISQDRPCKTRSSRNYRSKKIPSEQ